MTTPSRPRRTGVAGDQVPAPEVTVLEHRRNSTSSSSSAGAAPLAPQGQHPLGRPRFGAQARAGVQRLPTPTSQDVTDHQSQLRARSPGTSNHPDEPAAPVAVSTDAGRPPTWNRRAVSGRGPRSDRRHARQPAVTARKGPCYPEPGRTSTPIRARVSRCEEMENAPGQRIALAEANEPVRGRRARAGAAPRDREREPGVARPTRRLSRSGGSAGARQPASRRLRAAFQRLLGTVQSRSHSAPAAGRWAGAARARAVGKREVALDAKPAERGSGRGPALDHDPRAPLASACFAALNRRTAMSGDSPIASSSTPASSRAGSHPSTASSTVAVRGALGSRKRGSARRRLNPCSS